MAVTRLTPTSYVVLGLIEQIEPASPYDLKLAALLGVGQFWSLPHTQLYAECGRLAEAGLLSERREDSGRRRRLYRHHPQRAGTRSTAGAPSRPAISTSCATPACSSSSSAPIRSSSPPRQLEAHRGRLAEYEAQLEQCRQIDAPAGVIHAIEAGIGHEREYVRFWSRLLK